MGITEKISMSSSSGGVGCVVASGILRNTTGIVRDKQAGRAQMMEAVVDITCRPPTTSPRAASKLSSNDAPKSGILELASACC
jgi:hypothetical protein